VVDISDGEGYISPDGVNFTRVEEEQKCNLCLKAYTTDRK
ncbi:MAG: lectin like domain-containing protein, partial [Hungatella sp.]